MSDETNKLVTNEVYLRRSEMLTEIRCLVVEWLSKQGDDACWYYPDIFRQIAAVLGIEPPPIGLPRRCEFEAGCKRYQDELYTSDDGEPITLEWVAEHFGEVDINCHDEPLTRGQLRQLLAALGWRGEEETTDDR